VLSKMNVKHTTSKFIHRYFDILYINYVRIFCLNIEGDMHHHYQNLFQVGSIKKENVSL